MDPITFAAGIQVQSPKNVAAPAPTKSRPEPMEIEMPSRSEPYYNGPQTPGSVTYNPAEPVTPAEARTNPPTGYQTPQTPNEMETGTPGHLGTNVTAVVSSFWHPRMNRWRVLCACLTYFANGMNDAAAGPLIPYLESDYHIGYAIVSLIFVTNAAGFIAAGFCVDAISERIGRAGVLMLSEAICVVGYVILVCTPPFPAVIVAYLFLGLGMALNLAPNNVFSANMANSTVILGAAHGSYGIGGVVSPIIATALVSGGTIWSRFFLITLGLRCIVFVFAYWSNRTYETELTTQFPARLERIASSQRAAAKQSRSLKRAIRNKTTLMGALFIFAYQGAEVSISGWIISYLIAARGGDPAHVGYVTSGFWGGITVGRFVLSHAAPRVGEKLFVYSLLAGTVALQLLVWLIPDIIAEAVSVSILGVLLGPIYPCSQTIYARLLPGEIQMSALGFIASAGSSGGAVVPLMVGLLAEAAGTWILHPICIVSFVVMAICWFLLPKVVKRSE